MFPLWFLAKRRWKTLGWCFGAAVTSSLFMEFWFVQQGGFFGVMDSWFEASRTKSSIDGLSFWQNQSLFGLIYRWGPVFSGYSLSESFFPILFAGLSGASALFLWKVTTGRTTDFHSYSLFFIFTLLLSPDSRTAHFVWALPPFVYLLCRFGEHSTKVLRGFCAISFLISVLMSRDIVGKPARIFFSENNLYTLLLVMLLGCLLALPKVRDQRSKT